jgi:hypothetical protein
LISNLDPATEQNSIARYELLVSQSNNERIQKRPPCIVLLPLGVQESFSNVPNGRTEGELAFRVEGLVEDHRKNGGSCCHDTGEHEGDNHLDWLARVHRERACGQLTQIPPISGSAPAVQLPSFEAALSNMTHGAGMIALREPSCGG